MTGILSLFLDETTGSVSRSELMAGLGCASGASSRLEMVPGGGGVQLGDSGAPGASADKRGPK